MHDEIGCTWKDFDLDVLHEVLQGQPNHTPVGVSHFRISVL